MESSCKDQMFAKVVLASKPTNGSLPLITMHLHYPDIIHGELMTHRVLSRNARSMRAVPVAKMLEEIRTKPFTPWHWGKNQKGMQAAVENDALVSVPTFSGGCEDLSNIDAWLRARDFAASVAEGFMESDYHKQVANRILAPFTWKHTLITATSWANLLHLRDHDDAEPHFHDLAIMIREALETAAFQELNPGQWHLPYVTDADFEPVMAYLRAQGIHDDAERWRASGDIVKKLSVARAARISYAPFDGDGSIERELERYNLLVGSQPLHASPTEHQAMPDSVSTYQRQVKTYEGDVNGLGEQWKTVEVGNDYNNKHLSGNLAPGWVQFRKLLDGEYVADAA